MDEKQIKFPRYYVLMRDIKKPYFSHYRVSAETVRRKACHNLLVKLQLREIIHLTPSRD